MKAIYLVRRHRLAPPLFQGVARKTAAYNDDYKVVAVKENLSDARAKQLACETRAKARSPAAFRYTILRVPL